MGTETTKHRPPLSADGKSFLMAPEQAKPLFYNRCNPAEADWAAQQLCPEPIAPNATPASVSWERWGRLPRAFIECSHDQTLGLERQRMIHAAAPCDPVIRIDADHSPFLSAPEPLVQAMIAVVGKWRGR